MVGWWMRAAFWLIGLSLSLSAQASHGWSSDMATRWLTQPDAIWVADPSLGVDQALPSLLAADDSIRAPGLTGQAVWMRFDIHSHSQNTATYHLNNENVILAELTLFLYSADGVLLEEIILGRNQPDFAEKSSTERFHAQLTLEPEQNYHLLARLRSDTPVALALRVTSADDYPPWQRQAFATDWVLFAILATLLAFNLVLFFGRRDITQSWLVGFHALLILYVGALQGFAHHLLPADLVAWFSAHILVLNFIILILLYRFAMAFLSEGEPPPLETPRYRYGIPAVQLIGIGLALFYADRYIMPYFLLAQLLTIIPILQFSWRQVRNGYHPARLLIGALVVQVVGGGVGTLAFVGLWPVSDLALNAYVVAAIIELLFMAFAVAARLRFLEERQHIMLLTDPATGLPGRTYIEQELAEQWHRLCRRLDNPVLLLVQLNGFRTLMQLLGPGLVQRLSVQAVQHWNRGLSGLDGVVMLPSYQRAALAIFARDSFLVLVDQARQTDLQDQLSALNHLELEVDGQHFNLDSQVACFKVGSPPEALDEILRRLNVALVSGRQQGLTYQPYSLEQDTVFQRRIGIAQALPQALQARELRCHVQPVLDLHSRDVIGGEILLRWKSPIYGEVSPAEFIPLAEQMNRVSELTRFVLTEVDHWQQAPESPAVAAVGQPVGARSDHRGGWPRPDVRSGGHWPDTTAAQGGDHRNHADGAGRSVPGNAGPAARRRRHPVDRRFRNRLFLPGLLKPHPAG